MDYFYDSYKVVTTNSKKHILTNQSDIEKVSFDIGFCEFLEYHLSEAFTNSTDNKIKHLWCDGVNSELPIKTKKYINDNRMLETIAWIGTDGNSKYKMTIYFGNKSLSKYARGLDLKECVPSTETMDWINIDTDILTIDLHLM